MKVLLVATHWTPTFENCRRSLNVLDYDYSVLAYGEGWKGWKWRLQQYVDALPPEGTVMLLDAYDTVIAQPPDKVISVYKAHDKPVLVGAEWYCGGENCGKIRSWWKKRKCLFKPYRQHANAGCLIGEAKALKAMLLSMIRDPEEDDQLCLASYINAHTDQFAVDYGSSLVQNVHVLDDLDDQPCVYHFPGPCLKNNFFPQYNIVAERALGTSARKVHPDELQEFLTFLAYLAILCLFLP
jgi:hypothetical protein